MLSGMTWNASNRPRKNHASRSGGPRFRPNLEVLGDRTLPAVTSVLSAGTLTVSGDALGNSIALFTQGGQLHVVGDNVTRTFPEGNVFAVNVQAGGNVDVVSIASSLTNAIASLKVDGGSGSDQLKAHEPSVTLFARDYTVTSTTISRRLTPTITYSNFEGLVLDAAGVPGASHAMVHNTINVESLNTPLTINANDGDDVINLCKTGEFLDAITAEVTVHGGNGIDTVRLFDRNNSFGDQYFIATAGTHQIVDRLFFGSVNARSGIERMVLNTGADNSTYTLFNGTVMPLSIADEGGSDTLDYSQWGSTGVTVNLPAGTATGLVGDVSGVENVIGGPVADTFTGNSAANYFVGRGGADVMSGGEGTDILIGGVGGDQLTGGGGEDILIDGTTVYDQDVRALNAIMAEWSRTDQVGYATRVSHLTSGGGLNDPSPSEQYRLNLATVTEDEYSDTLTGNAGQDWFFARTPSLGSPFSTWDSVTDRSPLVVRGVPEEYLM